MRRKLVKYRGRYGSKYKHHNPYKSLRYSPYRLRPGRYRSPYLRRGYEVEPEQASYSPEPSYSKGNEGKLEIGQKVLSREEFFERYPPTFPEHWSEEFRREIMNRMYERYVDFMSWRALSEGLKEPQAEKKEEEKSKENLKEESIKFEQDPQDRLLEIIGEKGIDSQEGKAAYEELLRIQHTEINRLEDEYKKEVENSNEETNLSERLNEQPVEEYVSNVEELSQEEAEEILSRLEGELFNESLEQTEVKAEELADQALEMSNTEIEGLVEQALEETDIESVEIDSTLEGEVDAEYEDEGKAEV